VVGPPPKRYGGGKRHGIYKMNRNITKQELVGVMREAEKGKRGGAGDSRSKKHLGGPAEQLGGAGGKRKVAVSAEREESK